MKCHSKLSVKMHRRSNKYKEYQFIDLSVFLLFLCRKYKLTQTNDTQPKVTVPKWWNLWIVHVLITSHDQTDVLHTLAMILVPESFPDVCSKCINIKTCRTTLIHHAMFYSQMFQVTLPQSRRRLHVVSDHGLRPRMDAKISWFVYLTVIPDFCKKSSYPIHNTVRRFSDLPALRLRLV